MVYYIPHNFKIAIIKLKKNCNHLVTAYQGGQKNRNGKTTAVLFYHATQIGFRMCPCYLIMVVTPNCGRLHGFLPYGMSMKYTTPFMIFSVAYYLELLIAMTLYH